jgi:hypothetical protein
LFLLFADAGTDRNMDQDAFTAYMRSGGRSASVAARCQRIATDFEQFLRDERGGRSLEDARPEDLEAYVALIEAAPKASAKSQLWALHYYFGFSKNDEMRDLAGTLRQQRIKRKPFALSGFRGVSPEQTQKLAAIGIKNVDQMRQAGRTPSERQQVAAEAGIPVEAVLELVKLSDLARIPGLKGIRARLYYDAGVDTIEKLAEWDPEELRLMLGEYVALSGFDGIAPLPKETANAVATTQRLPRAVEV